MCLSAIYFEGYVICVLGDSDLTHPNRGHFFTSVLDFNWWMVLPFGQSLSISLDSLAHCLHWTDSVLKVRKVTFGKNVRTVRQFITFKLYLLTSF